MTTRRASRSSRLLSLFLLFALGIAGTAWSAAPPTYYKFMLGTYTGIPTGAVWNASMRLSGWIAMAQTIPPGNPYASELSGAVADWAFDDGVHHFDATNSQVAPYTNPMIGFQTDAGGNVAGGVFEFVSPPPPHSIGQTVHGIYVDSLNAIDRFAQAYDMTCTAIRNDGFCDKASAALSAAAHYGGAPTIIPTLTAPPQVNGSCGSSHGLGLTKPPVTGLCSAGVASPVLAGVLPTPAFPAATNGYVWSCASLGGGASQSCGAYANAGAVPYTAMYVFGDSNSDNGRRLTLEGIPLGPYYAGRHSDGPTAADVLAGNIGLSGANYVNYAVGGAFSGRGNADTDPRLAATGLLDQYDTFHATHALADSRALYFMWGGDNDINACQGATRDQCTPQQITQVVTNLQTLGQNLYALGGRHFLMVGPYGGGANKDSLRTQLSAAVQALIAAGVDIRYFDTRSPLLDMMALGNPYGFVNTSSSAPCYTGTMSVPGILCETPDTYVFWDSKGHLSARAHAAMGNLMEAALAVPPGKPTITGISVRGNSALVAFTPPSDVGSNPISGYTATCTPLAGGTGNVSSWHFTYEGATANAARVVSPTSPIVGTWLNPAAPIGPAAFTFFANGTYLLADNGNTTLNDPTGQPGIEAGTYTYNPVTHAFTTTCPTVDTDGQWGLSHGRRGGLTGCVGTAATITINGNSMVSVNTADGSTSNLSRVVDAGNAFVGTWYDPRLAAGPSGLSTALTFLADGTYLMADNGNTTANDPSGQPGLEVGTYAYNPATGAFSTTCPAINSDGQWGLSHGKRNGLAGCVGTAANIVMNGVSATGTSSPITVPGLTRGLTYTCSVHASNGSGNGPESAAKTKLLRPSPLVPMLSILQN